VQSKAATAELHVCPSGCDYSSIQAAVDAANYGDIIKVASSTYTDIHAHGSLTQVVYINKTVTIRGGYTTAFTDPPDPAAHPTTLDARGQGRVLYIAGNSSFIEGLRITGGNANGQGGSPNVDSGGGVYITSATATISDCTVLSNTAESGGGLYLYQSHTILSNNIVISNTAENAGGGLHLNNTTAALGGNIIEANIASNWGGGLFLDHDAATLNGNNIASNDAQAGGGIYLYLSPATLTDNVVASNTAAEGSAIYLSFSSATLVNNVIIGNYANSRIYVFASSPSLLHTTIANNTAVGGSGVYVTSNSMFGASTVLMTNTVLVSQTVGINVDSDNQATLNGVLWFGNGANTGGGGTLTITHATIGNPAFASDGYHLTAASAAIDHGVDAGITTDIDGQPRPWGCGFDLGADEYERNLTPVGNLRVVEAITDTGTLTVTLAWQKPSDAFTTSLRYATSPIIAGNWATANVLSDTLLGNTSSYTAVVPYSGHIYFAAKYWDTCGDESPISSNAFWPHWDVYLPLVMRLSQ
jgi:hypothetical protein